MAFAVGSGRGLAIPAFLILAVRFPGAFAPIGAIVGATMGLITGLLRKLFRRRPMATGPVWMDRPVRLPLLGQSKVARASGDEEPPPDRRRRIALVVAIAVLIPLAFVVLIAYGVGAYVGMQVDERLAAAALTADRDNPYWRVDDLIEHRDVVPDEENSALIIAEALGTSPENRPRGEPPESGTPDPAPSEVERAYARLAETPDNVRLDEPTASALRGSLSRLQESIRLLRTVADIARGTHELEYGPNLFDTKLPETQACRTAARLLLADAGLRAHDGDVDGAISSCRAILGVARSIGDEPFLISQLVRIAITNVATNAVRRALAQGEPSDQALSELQAVLLDELNQPLLVIAMNGERASYFEMIEKISTGEMPISALSENGPKDWEGGPITPIAPWARLMFDNQAAVALEWMNDAVAIARRPYADQPTRWKAWQDRIQEVRKSRFGMYTTTLPMLLMPAVDSAAVAHTRSNAELGTTLVLVAAERQRRKAGKWPGSIADIDPAILPTPPLDPCSGRSFRLKRRDGQLLVYSIGPNLEDEHGAYEPRKWSQGKPDDYGTRAWDVGLRNRPPTPPAP